MAVGVTGVVPLGVVGTVVPDGAGVPGWAAEVLALEAREGSLLRDADVWSVNRDVSPEC